MDLTDLIVLTAAWLGTGGLGAILGLVMGRNKRKAETAKALADTDASHALAIKTVTEASIAMLAEYRLEVSELRKEVDELRLQVERLEAENKTLKFMIEQGDK